MSADAALTEEWAVHFAGGNWQDRGWVDVPSRQEAERRASEVLGARVMRRQTTPWTDVTSKKVLIAAALRSASS